MQLVMSFIIYVSAEPTMSSGYYKVPLLIIQYSFTFILIVYALVHLFHGDNVKKQYRQLLSGVLLLLNFLTIFPFYAGMFLLVQTVEISEASFFGFVTFIVITGVLFYTATIYRLRKSIEAGNYRKESLQVDYDEVVEKEGQVLSKLPEFAIGGTGIVFIVSYLMSTMSDQLEDMSLIFICLLLFYVGIFLFAYSTISVYCKRRFISFNFNEEEQLYSAAKE